MFIWLRRVNFYPYRSSDKIGVPCLTLSNEEKPKYHDNFYIRLITRDDRKDPKCLRCPHSHAQRQRTDDGAVGELSPRYQGFGKRVCRAITNEHIVQPIWSRELSYHERVFMKRCVERSLTVGIFFDRFG
jgi:hypothetical protein